MSVNYLVDYENVHEPGLYGLSSLTAEDRVYIFHTGASDRIALSCFDGIQAWVKAIMVPAGKQSLDMHLGSFLGYLIGREEDSGTQYRIVSNDTDYWGIMDFWNRSYGRQDKVMNVQRLMVPESVSVKDALIQVDPDAEHEVIRDYIVRVFRDYGTTGLHGRPCMLVSEICEKLNCLPEYCNARRRLVKKPMQFLTEECWDIVQVKRLQCQDWVYLIAEKKKTGTVKADPEDRAPQALQSVDDELPTEEELPDIMEMGDLTIDDEIPDAAELYDAYPPAEEDLSAKGAAWRSSQNAEPAEEATAPAEAQEALDLKAAAETVFRELADAEKNAGGSVRASSLRDRMMQIPEFRTVLKESGMKPIEFMQQQFAGTIRIRREKGIYWVESIDPGEDASEKDNEPDELPKRRAAFFKRAFSNIQKQLSDAGLTKETADEIADIFVHADSSVEPRKIIHTLLCQRFGTKIGSKYYRQAVKYVSM